MTKEEKEKICDEIIGKYYRPKCPQLTKEELKQIYLSILECLNTEQNQSLSADDKLENLKKLNHYQTLLREKSIAVGCQIAKELYLNNETTEEFEDLLQESLFRIASYNLISYAKTSKGFVSFYKGLLKMRIKRDILNIELKEACYNRDIALRQQYGNVVPYDTVIDEAISDKIPLDEHAILEEKCRKVREALKTIPGREQKILSLKFGDELTYREIGKKYNLSAERVRQIVSRGTRLMRHPSHSKHLREYVK